MDVEYQPLPSVSDCRDALAPGAPTAHREARDNVVKEIRTEYGDCDAAFTAASHVFSVSLKQHRGGHTPSSRVESSRVRKPTRTR